MIILSGCFEAYASSCHASFCSWTIGHTSNGSSDSHCKGELLKHLLHFTPSLLHQWIQLRFLLSFIKIEALQSIFYYENAAFVMQWTYIITNSKLFDPIFISSPRSRAPLRVLLVTASSPTVRAARGFTTTENNSQPLSSMRFHSFTQDPEAILMDKMVWHLPTSPKARLYYFFFLY